MKLSDRSLAKIDGDLVSRDEGTRWQAAITLGELAELDPERIWPLVVKHGSRRHADARMAIATCVLEHILEHHFDIFFPRVAAIARSDKWFRTTFGSCWQMGEAESPRNIKLWNKLEKDLDASSRSSAKRKRGAPTRRTCGRPVLC